jgi:hypothetical protein
MNRNKITKALAGSLLVAASMSAVAKVETFNLNFVTIQDLTITQVNAVGFGQNVIGKANTSCTIGLATNLTGNALTAAATSEMVDGISGTGCLTVAANATNTFAGVFTITGATNQTINVTVASATGTDFNYTPSGQVYTVGTNTPTDVFADSSASIGLGANSQANLYLGGTIAVNGTDLDANKPYSLNFDVTAVY